MMNKKTGKAITSAIILLLGACTSANISTYYRQNSKTLNSIAYNYRVQYQHTPFAILFTDKSFNNVSIEILTDSIRYIYEFAVGESRLKDTLVKYHLPVAEVSSLITGMQSVHCTWIDNLDYYTDGKKNLLVYMSIRSRAFNFPLMDKKYYILTYYSQPQYYDEEGRLLDRRKRRQLRRINNEIFRRINDSVCYTISDIFR
jgi:hypothetical protein